MSKLRYRVGFEHPAVQSGWSQRVLAGEPTAVLVVDTQSVFAFGEVLCACPNTKTAQSLVDTLNAVDLLRKSVA